MNYRRCFTRSIAAALGVAAAVVAASSQLLLLLSFPIPNVSALRTSPTTTTNAIHKNSNTAKSFVELYDPKTNTDIVLLGCLHGSLSSTIDVKQILLGESASAERENNNEAATMPLCAKATENHRFPQQNPRGDPVVPFLPDAVVLELCGPRYKDLVESRSEIIEDYATYDFWKDMVLYWKRTLKDNNPILALVKIAIGTTSLVQTNLSGIRAGLEFEVAIDIVEDYNKNNKEIRLVLGDRNIDETMERIGSLPSVSLDLLSGGSSSTDGNDHWQSPWSSVNHASERLWISVLGNSNLPLNAQICMPKVLLRNAQARNDLGRLLLLPAVAATFFALLLAFIANGFEPDPYDVLLWETISSSPLRSPDFDLSTSLHAIGALATNSVWDVLALLAGYVVLALPASKVIISERDAVLVRSIVDTLELTKGCHRLDDSSEKRHKLVAVVGLLHVNGVAEQLIERGCCSRKKT